MKKMLKKLVAGKSSAALPSNTSSDQIANNVGTEVENAQFPFHALLKQDHLYICGGVIIHKNWVLTAGQCVNTNDPWNLEVC
jgi:secreted trypsin-like serine protease